MKVRARTVFAWVVLTQLTVLPAMAQETHDVRGIVADSAGGGVEGAMVVALALPDSVLTKFSLTDGDGRFTLRRVPVGAYVLQVTMVGHQTVREGLTVGPSDVDVGSIPIQSPS
jgi:hypothetical protein